MKKHYILLLALYLGCLHHQYGQSSLKRSKQMTNFHYVQANLHYGYFTPVGSEEYQFDVPTSGPRNRIAYQFLSKNQRLLQKGYVRNVAINRFRFRFTTGFNGTLQDVPVKDDVYQLRLQNLEASFRTKWDRTSFSVGYANVRFGHNPKIDPVTDFAANSTQRDLGFSQDFGVSFRTALSPKYDFRASLYTGGVFSKPLVAYTVGHFVDDEGQEQQKEQWETIDLNYEANWLTTFRVGTPLFRPLEYGLIAMFGKVQNGESNKTISRVGGDVIKKFGEQLKLGSQVATGFTNYEGALNSFDITVQNNVEYYLKGMFIFNISHALIFNELWGGESMNNDRRTAGQLIGSASFVVSPHTRIRAHYFYNYQNYLDNNQGLTFQLVTGIGRR